MVRDRIIFATNSPRVREKLLSQGSELTLDKAIDIARSYELSQVQLKAMANDSHEVHAIHRKPGRPNFMKGASRHHDSPKTHENACSKCEGHHNKSTECPAKGKQCLKCRKFNHYAKVCKTKSHTPGRTAHREIHTVDEDYEDDGSALFIDTYLLTVTTEKEDEESAYAAIRLGPQNKKLTFKLDTGAQASVIPAKDFNALMPNTQLMAADRKLTGYG